MVERIPRSNSRVIAALRSAAADPVARVVTAISNGHRPTAMAVGCVAFGAVEREPVMNREITALHLEAEDLFVGKSCAGTRGR